MKIKHLLVAVATLASVLAFSGQAEAATQTFSVRCSGSDAASQGSLALVGGSIDASVTVTHDVSETEVPGATVAPSFTVATNIAPTLIDTAINLLGISSVAVSNVNFSVAGDGAGVSQSAVFGPFNETLAVSPGTGLSFSRGPVQTAEATTGVGVISYRLSPITMKVAIGAIQVNVNCASLGSNVVAKTFVRDPDAPVIKNASLETAPGGSVSINLSELVTPGPTPVIGDSYRVVEGPGTVSGSTLSLTAPDAPGTYTTTFEVCAEPKSDSGTPGINEVVNLAFNSVEQNERPVAFSLKVGDIETPLVWTTRRTPGIWPWLTLPASDNTQDKADMSDWGEYLFTTSFKAPTAANIQAALATAGFDTSVTGTFPNFQVEFVGKDAEKDVADVTVGRWLTVLPYEFFTQISELVSSVPTGDSTAPPRPLLSNAQIWALILAGKLDQAGVAIQAHLLANLKEAAPRLLKFLVDSFNQPPLITSTNGEPAAPSEPLCSQGQVDVVVVAGPAATTTGEAPVASGGGLAARPASEPAVEPRPIRFTG